MRELIIIGSYCNTEAKLTALERAITLIKSLGHDVMVFGRYPIPERLQAMCDYWIFDKSNPVMPDRTIVYWKADAHLKLANSCYDYGFAAIEQIPKTLGFAKSLGYDIAYWLVYDVDLTEFPRFRQLCLEKFQSGGFSALCEPFFPYSQLGRRGIGTTVLALKVADSHSKLKGVITQTFYRSHFKKLGSAFLAEDFLEECFKLSELNYHVFEEDLKLPATVTSLGDRVHGSIPKSCQLTRQRIGTAFIGKRTETQKPVIFISEMSSPIQKMTVDLGEDSEIELSINGEPRFEHELSRIPTRCIVKQIDGVDVNETLDENYSADHWDRTTINNIIN